MNNFDFKSYKDSWIYNLMGSKNKSGAETARLYDSSFIEFILKSQRIDKSSNEFKDIIEDVKRHQTSSILYTVLMMDNVVLCINNVPLTRAFKVFEASDLRTDKTKKVFIDVTGLIEYKNNTFVCKNFDFLVDYLLSALVYLIYRNEPVKMTNNSSLTISATECYVSLCSYILDYLRLIGYAENRNKISYLFALFFLYNMIGKDLDNYTKNIAAKIAGIPANQINAMDLYIDDNMFENIDTFFSSIITSFKLKGLTIEVFIAKWMYQYGESTRFGIELFTSLATMLTNAFGGGYIINQKQIERCCGSSMIKFATALIKMGTDIFDNRGYMESAEFDKTIVRDKSTSLLAESFLSKEPNVSKDDFASKQSLTKKVKEIISYYSNIKRIDKLSKKLSSICNNIISDKATVESGSLESVMKLSKKYLVEKDREKLLNTIDRYCDKYVDNMKKFKEEGNKEKASYYSKKLIELRKSKTNI